MKFDDCFVVIVNALTCYRKFTYLGETHTQYMDTTGGLSYKFQRPYIKEILGLSHQGLVTQLAKHPMLIVNL